MEEIFDESHVSIKMEPTIEFFSSDEYVNENDHIYGDFANSKLTLDNEHEETDYGKFLLPNQGNRVNEKFVKN